MTEQMQQAVARGIELLDAKVPGWWQRIDVAELEMNECSSCVLGQLFQRVSEPCASYGDGLVALKMVDGREHGFDLPAPEYARSRLDVREEWDALREVWVAEIKRRWDEGFDL